MYNLLPLFKSRHQGLRSHDVILRGRKSILELHHVLSSFCAECGQDGRMDDLHYFFEKSGILDSEPILFLLLKAPVATVADITCNDLSGAILMYEYRFLGLRLKALSVVDRAGGALIARSEDRVRIAARMRDVLMQSGVHLAMLSVDATGYADPAAALTAEIATTKSHRWKMRHRHYAAYLEMQSSMDETLANINQKTRFNLRYYRRRAERDFGSYFLPQISITEQELIAFNRDSSHPSSDKVLRWRLVGQKLLQQPVLVGVKDKDGQWLSILAARRNGDRSEILWQMNRANLPQHSIGTVMRSYFMESEIAQGCRRLYVEQGTPHLMKNSFVHRDLYDIVLVRNSISSMLKKLTKKYLPADNPLAELLHDPALAWQTYDPAMIPKAEPRRQERRRPSIT